jgi:hypothetical protein
MQAITATSTNQRQPNGQARARALVRFNAVTFHSLAAASFLETAVALHVKCQAPAYAAHPDVKAWFEQVWWPQRAELGRQLREYIEATWPEFDWNAAWQDFHASYRPHAAHAGKHGGMALAALGLCVTSAQAALFYRALANSADDPALRQLARRAAGDHAGFFDYFRALFDRCKQVRRVGITATWRTVIAVSRSARDLDVAAAFQVVGENWNGAPIVPLLDYSQYRERMLQSIRRHAPLGPVERLLFRPWLERAAPAPQQPSARPGRWPLLAQQAA